MSFVTKSAKFRPASGEHATAKLATACRSCGSSGLSVFLDLGETPLANALITEDQLGASEPVYPLELALCLNCTLVQITATVPPEQMFREYVYYSSYSDTMVRHAKSIAERLIQREGLNADSLVVEIASNDGYLLRYFVDAGVPVLGIEPARNIARVAVARGVATLPEFFDRGLAETLVAEGRQADVVLANNVLAHIPDINGMVAGVKEILKPRGAFVFETPYIKDLLDQVEFDTIYHEHLFYYSMTALDALLRRHGLAAAEVERLPIHGGSLRVTAVHAGREAAASSVHDLLEREASWGVGRHDSYCDFAERVATLGTDLRDLLDEFKSAGKRIAAYGAAAKGSTLLNAFGIGSDQLDFVADRSPIKQGRYMPGVHLPVVAPERLLEAMPDYTLLLTWNFADEIMAQQAEYRRRGGKFIIPVPEPLVV
jgi:SAM-dependent methyltransferase